MSHTVWLRWNRSAPHWHWHASCTFYLTHTKQSNDNLPRWQTCNRYNAVLFYLICKGNFCPYLPCWGLGLSWYLSRGHGASREEPADIVRLSVRPPSSLLIYFYYGMTVLTDTQGAGSASSAHIHHVIVTSTITRCLESRRTQYYSDFSRWLIWRYVLVRLWF